MIFGGRGSGERFVTVDPITRYRVVRSEGDCAISVYSDASQSEGGAGESNTFACLGIHRVRNNRDTDYPRTPLCRRSFIFLFLAHARALMPEIFIVSADRQDNEIGTPRKRLQARTLSSVSVQFFRNVFFSRARTVSTNSEKKNEK